VTEKTTAVLAGQQITLKVVCDANSPSNIAWSIPVNNFADYAPNNQTAKKVTLTNTQLADNEITFYWADSGAKSVSVTFKCGTDSCEKKTTFNVKKPECQLTIQMGKLRMAQDGTAYGIYSPNGLTPGIIFRGKVTTPSGYPNGKFQFVQRLQAKEFIIKFRSDGACGQQVLKSNNQPSPDIWRCDGKYPYNLDLSPTPPDSYPADGSEVLNIDTPETALESPTTPEPLDEARKNTNFEMYILFKPADQNGSSNKYVPLRVIVWKYSFCIRKLQAGWNDFKPFQDPPMYTGTLVNSTETSSHPEWEVNQPSDTKLIPVNCPAPCN